MKEIIKDSRIVSDITFATRLKHFLTNVTVNDAMGYEELEYLKQVADSLLAHQINTVTDAWEKKYLMQNN